jgi:filamentous hemagglutinin family protein
MTGVFMLQQTMALSVIASEISGVTGVNGVYNIDPASKSGGTGFRGYEKFNLDAGDVANLNFADINTFVNLVDNQININGIVNSVRGNGFYNGKAIFVSPNGMVVGASGVLNVGSLGVYSPDSYSYNQLKNNMTEEGLATLINDDMNTGGAIKINGKVVTSGDIDLRASSVDIGKDAVVVG